MDTNRFCLQVLPDQKLGFYYGDGKSTNTDFSKIQIALIDSESFASQAGKLQAWLEYAESVATSSSLECQIAFRQLFCDDRYISPGPQTFVSSIAPNLPDKVMVSVYRGVYKFLQFESRYQRFDARLVFFYCAWQWLDLVKRILVFQKNLQQDQSWVNEMAVAYREVAALISSDDLRLHQTIQLLAKADQKGMPQVINRERLRLQLLMVHDDEPGNRFSPFPSFSPRQLYEPKILWDQQSQKNGFAIRLHPVFLSKQGAVAAVRALASEESLQDYDFETALRIGNFLSGRRWNLHNQPIWFAFTAIVITILAGTMAVANLAAIRLGGVYKPFIQIWPAYLWPWLGLFGVILLFITAFTARLLPRLFLPRLIGGILIGFSALAIQSDSLSISKVIWQGGYSLVALLWLAVLGISGVYIYNDIVPRISDRTEARRRAVQSVSVFAIFAIVIGLCILSFTTTAFSDKLVSPVLILGPTGIVDVKIWLTYTPLALFLGIVTQFLFEDKTITSSVWPVEKE